MSKRMPTRSEAIDTLCGLINTGIFSEETEESLRDIATCIENELGLLDIWGANQDNIGALWLSYRRPEEGDSAEYKKVFEDWVESCKAICKEYRMECRDGGMYFDFETEELVEDEED